MKISVIGCGYLGAVHAASMAELGHEVVGIDVDQRKIEALAQARTPFYEPGFEELLGQSLQPGRLRFSSEFADAAGAEVHFLCVGTPQKRGEYAPQPVFVQVPAQPGNGLGVAGFVTGLLGLIFCWVPALGIILALLGVIMGGVGIATGKKKGASIGLAIAGLVLGIIALIPAIVILSAAASVAGSL